MSPRWVYVGVDGDNVGRRLEALIGHGDEAGARSLAIAVEARLRSFAEHVETAGGRLVFCAGDSLLAWVPLDAAREICRVAASACDGLVFSGGLGPEMMHAMLALKLAKAQGRGRYIEWDAVGRGMSGDQVAAETKEPMSCATRPR